MVKASLIVLSFSLDFPNCPLYIPGNFHLQSRRLIERSPKMKNRRGFMAALGASAGAFVLGLPATSHACGRLRRRYRNCCSQCGKVDEECSCPAHPAYGESGYRATSTGTVCTCACPQSLYMQSGSTYYYHATCCADLSACNASSTQLFNCPISCPNTNCIGTGCSSRSPYPIYRRRLVRDTADCHFVLDPKAIWFDVDPKKKHKKVPKLHFEDYANGIVAKNADELRKGFKPNEDKKTKIEDAGYIKYSTDRDLIVALFKVTREGVPDECTLFIGFEIRDSPSGLVELNGKVDIPFPKDLSHYHKVTHKKTIYHVATKEIE